MVSINFNRSSALLHTIAATTERRQTRSMEQLASGERLQQASYDPAAMVLADQMRFQLRGMNRAVDNISEGVAMVQTAEAALGEVNNLLTRLRNLALNAANEGTNDSLQFNALQTEFDEAIDSISRIGEQTRFGSLPLLQGALNGNRLDSISTPYFDAVDLASAQMPGGVMKGSTLTMTLAAPLTTDRSRVSAVMTTAPASGVPTLATSLQGLYQNGTQLTAVNGVVTLAGERGTTPLTVTPTTTIGDFLAMVNAVTPATGITAHFDDVTGALDLQSSLYGASSLVIDTPAFGVGIGLLDSAPANNTTNALLTTGTDQTFDFSFSDGQGIVRTTTLTQDHATGDGLTFSNQAGGPEVSAPFSGWEPGAIRVTLTEAGDPTVVPTTFTVPVGTFTATRESTTAIQVGPRSTERTTIDIPDSRASGLGHTANLAGSGYPSLQSLKNRQVLLNSNYDTALKVIDAAINEVTTIRGELGATQSNGLESGQESMRVAFENLTSAESLLRDTDYAKEMAEFTRLDIVAQATVAMLGQANQIPQRVLELLRNTG